MFNSIAKVIPLVRPYVRHFAVFVLLTLVSQSFDTATPYLMGQILNAAIGGNREAAIRLIAILTVILLLSVVVIRAKEVFQIRRLYFTIPAGVAGKTWGKLFSLSVGQHRAQHSGVTQSVISQGHNALTSFIFTILYEVFPLCARTLLIIAGVLWLNWILGLIVLAGSLGLLYATIGIDRRFGRAFSHIRDQLIERDRLQSDISRNLAFIQLNAQERRMESELADAFAKHAATGTKVMTRFENASALRNLIALATKVLLLGAGVLLIASGQLKPGAFVTSILWTTVILNSMVTAANLHKRMLELSVTVDRYLSILQLQSDLPINANAVAPAIRGRIAFCNVSFKYSHHAYLSSIDNSSEQEADSERSILHDVSFHIEAGERVALVGRSGAGKSTIVAILLRCYDPTKGKIQIDGTDLTQLDLGHYRRSVGLIEQTGVLLDNTLRYNLEFCVGSETMEPKHIERIADMARVTDFARVMPHGLDTRIGENGVVLSGGERQRVSLGRMLAKNPSILILDEATSQLDSINEMILNEAIEVVSKNRTTLIVTHRLSTIAACDRILVLDRGKLVSSGTHEDLLARCETYRALIEAQSGRRSLAMRAPHGSPTLGVRLTTPSVPESTLL